MPMNKKIGTISRKIHTPYEWIIKPWTPWIIIRSVSWQNSIDLNNAIQDELLEVKAFWWIKQEWTPTPDDPKDIICNNWTIKITSNILDMCSENIVVWKYIDDLWDIQDDSENFYNSKFIPTIWWSDYTWSSSVEVFDVSIMEYDINKNFIKRTLFENWTPWKKSWKLTLWETTAFVLFGSNPLNSNISIDDISAIKRQLENYNAPTSHSEYWIYADWTTEIIEDSIWNAGVVENLLSISSDKDEQELLTWNIVRYVWIKILDWSENWTKISSPLWNIFQADLLDQNMFSHLICSHFQNNTPLNDNIIYKSAGSSIVQIRYDTASTVQDFVQFLISQYTSKNPVLIVYWLQNPKQEKVDWQTLNVQTWSNTISIIQSSLNDLNLSAKYKATA